MTIQTAVLIETLTELGAEVGGRVAIYFPLRTTAAAAVVVGATEQLMNPMECRCLPGKVKRWRNTGGQPTK